MSAVTRPIVATRQLRALIVEDRDDDLLLLLHELERAGYAVTYRRADTVAGLRCALAEGEWEIVVSDFTLPTMTAHDVLKVLRAEHPDLPCIVISGTIAEESAVDVLKAGARDFVVKERMTRLVPAIEREVREAAERRLQRAAEATLQQTRERMQFALESVGVGFWEWEIESGRVAWSEVQERLHGMAPGTFGGTLDAAIASVHPDDREPLLRQGDEAQRTGRDSRVEYRTTWPDGSVHWIVGIGRVLYENSVAVRAVGVGMDVTGQKRLEEQFRQAQKMESVGNLAGGIAHDFNNLLTVITGCSDLAAPQVAGNAELAELIDAIRGAAVSAGALTRQLLTFSRRQVVVPRLLDLSETVSGFGKILRRLVEENVHIEFNLSPALPSVSVDPGQVEQLVLNLVANARDAMPDGGTVTVETRRVTIESQDVPASSELRAGAYVMLSVSDTGSGMSKEVLTHLFEPFFTTKPAGRGTGLGLATVYGIVKQSGGHIGVQSAPGAGTTFRIYFPIAPESSDSRPAEEKSKAVSVTAGTGTVLVVEDNAPLRRLSERMLRQHGYTVLLATNGAQARQICAAHDGPIDVVLMDVIMPGESGPSVWEQIREHRPETKIIYMSGYTGDTLDQRPVVGPGNGFLQKPFDAAQLAGAVLEALQARRNARVPPSGS